MASHSKTQFGSGETESPFSDSHASGRTRGTDHLGNVQYGTDHNTKRSGNVPSGDVHVGPIQGVTQGASNVFGDILDLAELQVQLLTSDAQECSRRAKLGIVGLIVTLAVLLASLPVLALGISELIRWVSEWPLWVCHLIVGAGFTVTGVAIGVWCVSILRNSLKSFANSQREASENLHWLRQTLSKTFT